MGDDKKNKYDYKRKSVKSLPKVKTNKPSFPMGLNKLASNPFNGYYYAMQES